MRRPPRRAGVAVVEGILREIRGAHTTIIVVVVVVWCGRYSKERHPGEDTSTSRSDDSVGGTASSVRC